jgi:hypothetical protein
MRPLARRLVAVYAILGVAAFAFPGGLEGWLDDRNASGWLNAPLGFMHGVDAVSTAVGVKAIGRRLRESFRNKVGDDED